MEETKNSLSSRSLPYLPLSYTLFFSLNPNKPKDTFIFVCLITTVFLLAASCMSSHPSIHGRVHPVHPGQVAISSQ